MNNNIKERLKVLLLSGGTITALQALNRWGTLRIAVYVARLRRSGLKIKTIMVTKGNKTFAKYSL